MSIIDKLASTLGRKDEVPNQELAKEIAERQDSKAVEELIQLLKHKNKDIQSDSIKVLYEIGARSPALIADYGSVFLDLLKSKNNRLQWGGMAALQSITLENPGFIYASLPRIIEGMEAGSVITKDGGMMVLIQLCSLDKYAEEAFSLFNEQLLRSPVNQLPMYAERALPIINANNKAAFVKTLTERLEDIVQESKRKRVEKVIKKL